MGVLEGHTGDVISARFSNDGRWILTTSRDSEEGRDSTARVWDANSLKSVAILRGHSGAIAHASFSPDDKQIITASLDGTARLWNAKTGEEITILERDSEPVRDAGFSSDGKLIIVSAGNGVTVWDERNLAKVADISTHGKAVFSARISPDGTKILTGSADKSAQIRPIYLGWQTLLSNVKVAAPRCLTVTQLLEVYLRPEPPRWCITGPGQTSEPDPAKWQPKWPYQTAAWRDWLLAKDRGEDPQIPK
jgi:WD40 repeat protein